jgi:hypothetical protein
MLWLSFIFVIVLLAYIVIGLKPKKEVYVAVPKGPRVQPIVIRRKYIGPESIYPSKMEIYTDKETPRKWREYGVEPVGKFVGRGIRKIWDFFGGE